MSGARGNLTETRPAPRRRGQLSAALRLGSGERSIPYALDGFFYEAFVLGRGGDEYGDDELDLARHLQTLIRGLYLRLAPVATSASRLTRRAPRQATVGLTATEFAVLVLLADGHTTYGISRRLGMAPRTASKHLERIYRKSWTSPTVLLPSTSPAPSALSVIAAPDLATRDPEASRSASSRRHGTTPTSKVLVGSFEFLEPDLRSTELGLGAGVPLEHQLIDETLPREGAEIEIALSGCSRLLVPVSLLSVDPVRGVGN